MRFLTFLPAKVKRVILALLLGALLFAGGCWMPATGVNYPAPVSRTMGVVR